MNLANFNRYAVLVGFVVVLPWRSFFAMAKVYYAARKAKKTAKDAPQVSKDQK